ncbi:recombinase RecT [Photobacterium toruni]|uniref:recombinase RecT n=1 Tax=Photobacterium toruni TaxID=1935446 RepID=UPI002110286B|nr:recombinase RecT [Photobacterium toruni]
MNPFEREVSYMRVKTPLWSASNTQPKQSDLEKEKAAKYTNKSSSVQSPIQQQRPIQQQQQQRPIQQQQRPKQQQVPLVSPFLAPFDAIEQSQEIFTAHNQQYKSINGSALTFKEEALYARNIILDNYNSASDKKYALASATVDSVQRALYMAATVGLSLNPIKKHAYLVPRFNKNSGRLECHLEPSYRGLEYIAFRAGILKKVHCVLVYAKDKFEWINECERPRHEFNPFHGQKERGQFVGGYCIADFNDQTQHISFATAGTISLCQSVSLYDGIWNKWQDKMREKTIIKQAFGEWPLFDPCVTALSSYFNACDEEVLN